MRKVNLAEAKAHLSELVALAADGEPICIMRRGKAVARLVPAEGARKPIAASELRAVTEGTPLQQESAGEFMRRVRNDERY